MKVSINSNHVDACKSVSGFIDETIDDGNTRGVYFRHLCLAQDILEKISMLSPGQTLTFECKELELW